MPALENTRQFRLSTLPSSINFGLYQVRTWVEGTTFDITEYVIVDDVPYLCILRHVATFGNRPGAASASSYWQAGLLPNTHYYIGDDTSRVHYYTSSANPPVATAEEEGARISPVAGSTRTLTNVDHGKMLAFAQACTVTVPTGLRPDFSCGWSQEAAGVVTFVGSGVTIQSKGGGLASSAQYSMGGVTAWGSSTLFRLSGV